MLTIRVKVPRTRNSAATVECFSGGSRLSSGFAAASATAALGAKHGNRPLDPLRPWGHPPEGRYLLLAQGPVPKRCEIEYGKVLLIFEAVSGAALEAEAFGRFLLPIYAGPAGADGRLRRTQGGVRLQQDQFDSLLGELKRDAEAAVEIGRLSPPWWQFWNREASTAPLSAEAPRVSAPPQDEITLAGLITAGKRLPRRARQQPEDDDWRRDDSSSSSSSGSGSGYSGGRGGTYGGSGASGSWEAAGRGVDASGRIVAAAAGAALAGGAAATASEDGNAGSGDGADTTISTSY